MKSHDDQVILNRALKNCSIQWRSVKNISTDPIDGFCLKNNLSLTVLPQSSICRIQCKDTASVYVWHPLSLSKGDKKKTSIKDSHLWYLREDWRETLEAEGNQGTSLEPSSRGTKWLSLLSI